MTWVVGGAGTNETFNGIINNECSNSKYKGTTSIVKDGTGYWRLTGANIYAGTTLVKHGTLIVNGIQTGTGAVTVNDEATLAGKGTIPGATVINEGGIIQSGDPFATTSLNIGTLTVGSLTMLNGSEARMEISKTSNTADKVVSKAGITFDGTLRLTISGTLADGDQYVLFTGTSYAGAFDSIVPIVPGPGLEWKFSNGVLHVQAATGIYQPSDNRIKIYPNPVTERAELQLDKPYSRTTVTVETASGICVMQQEFLSTGQLRINTSSLPKGMYLIRVKADDEINSCYKIMKK
jgi:autotransporter-associated beta strand protein